MLPGLDGTGRLFTPLLAALPASLSPTVIAYPTAQEQSYAELERQVLASLPTDERYVLLGESFSGPVAVSIAARNPKGLVGLVLVCSFVRCPVPLLRYAKRLTSVLPIHWVPNGLIAYFAFGRFRTPALVQQLLTAVGVVVPAVLQARFRAIADVDVRAHLKEVKVPIMYLRASEDRLVPKSALALICSLVPSVRSVSIVAPHCLLQAAPAEAARSIANFEEWLRVGL
jgi:pimeloyl-ACP methyl ester carboxylesterase